MYHRLLTLNHHLVCLGCVLLPVVCHWFCVDLLLCCRTRQVRVSNLVRKFRPRGEELDSDEWGYGKTAITEKSSTRQVHFMLSCGISTRPKLISLSRIPEITIVAFHNLGSHKGKATNNSSDSTSTTWACFTYARKLSPLLVKRLCCICGHVNIRQISSSRWRRWAAEHNGTRVASLVIVVLYAVAKIWPVIELGRSRCVTAIGLSSTRVQPTEIEKAHHTRCKLRLILRQMCHTGLFQL